jgi:SagB-type dehydrogenase family enzyme
MLKDKHIPAVTLMLVAVLLFGVVSCAPPVSNEGCGTLQAELDRAGAELVKLQAELQGVKAASLEELLRQRRSIREYSDAALTQDEVMKLLWAGQGITSDRGFRTAPSAGALYPLELYLVAGNVDNLAPGIYKYKPAQNDLVLVREGDVRANLAAASVGQGSVAEGAIDIVITAVYERTEIKYGVRGERYVQIEVGHVAQNICLEATALGLGLVTIGAFDDTEVAKVVGMSQDESPLYVMPVGRIK